MEQRKETTVTTDVIPTPEQCQANTSPNKEQDETNVSQKVENNVDSSNTEDEAQSINTADESTVKTKERSHRDEINAADQGRDETNADDQGRDETNADDHLKSEGMRYVNINKMKTNTGNHEVKHTATNKSTIQSHIDNELVGSMFHKISESFIQTIVETDEKQECVKDIETEVSTIDGTSGYPTNMTDIIFNHILPPPPQENRDDQTKEASLLQTLTTHWEGTPEVMISICGDYVTGLSLPKYFNKLNSKEDKPQMNSDPTAIDMIFIVREKGAYTHGNVTDDKLGCFIITPDDKDSGSLMLEIINTNNTVDDLKIQMEDRQFLASRNLWYGMRDAIGKTLGDNERVMEKLTLTQQNSIFESDLSKILVLRCMDWPRDATDFMKRERVHGWPSQGAINKIYQNGCYIYPDKSKPATWKYLFSEAEKLLERELDHTHRHCYQIITLLLHSELKSSKDVTNHTKNERNSSGVVANHIKTIMFWEVEKQPLLWWKSRGITRCVYHVLDMYLKALQDYKLPNYFIPASNVLQPTPRHEMSKLIQLVQQIREDPLKPLVDFLSSFRFKHLPLGSEFEALLQISNQKTKIGWTNEKGVALAVMFLVDSAKSFLLEDKVKEAIDTLIQTGAIENKICPIEHTLPHASTLTSVCMNKISVETMLAFFEGVISLAKDAHIVTGSEELRSLCQNGACYYNVAWNIAENVDEKQRHQERSKQLFSEAMCCDTVTQSVLADYANGLFIWGEYDTCIEIAEKILKPERPLEASENFYGIHPREPLEARIREEVDVFGSFSIVPAALAHYLIVCSHIAQKRTSDAKDAVKAFTEFNDTFSEMKQKAPIFILLGEACEKIESYSEALVQYEFARSLIENHPLLDDKIETLNAIILSLEDQYGHY